MAFGLMANPPTAPARDGSIPSELRSSTKVYLEDTDAFGIVYHANYLKYFERARTDYLESHGIGLKGAQARGLRFVVHSLTMTFHRPAMLGDRLEIRTTIQRASAYRLVFDHKAIREGESSAATSAKVDVVCIDDAGDLTELSSELLTI